MNTSSEKNTLWSHETTFPFFNSSPVCFPYVSLKVTQQKPLELIYDEYVNKWSHFVLTSDPIHGLTSVFIDGKLVMVVFRGFWFVFVPSLPRY